MFYYIILLLAIIIFCYLEYADKKSDCKQAKELSEQFDAWIESQATTTKPSNAVFTKLYKKRYGKEEFAQNIVQRKANIIATNQVDVVASFPSLNQNILGAQIGIVDNLESYYELQFEEVKSLKYFIHFILSLPLQLLKYIGIDEEKSSSKLIQVIIWVVGLFLPPLKDLLIDFIRFISLPK
ncbi:hypothetical protein ABID29_001778 [Streptococcus rupicaprae]|uniref:Uncharacterized protein n=1 Tax=Streptococcus rupicaprae TaxID=759619 RepID=A0ABV2FJC3_9STRE